MEFLIFLVVLAAVVVFVSRPLLRSTAGRPRGRKGKSATEVGDLKAAREAKYREIRDAELDHRTGKLSRDDYDAIDRSLRAEALAILRQLDRALASEGDAHGSKPEPLAGPPRANGG